MVAVFTEWFCGKGLSILSTIYAKNTTCDSNYPVVSAPDPVVSYPEIKFDQ
jgi:hypothetical protein